MIPVLIAINIIAGLFLIGVVLLQSGKGADMGAAFGGANSTMFGPSGAGNALTKATAGFAALFMLTSLALAVMSAETGSVFDNVELPTAAAPAPEATAPIAAVPPSPPSGAFDPEAAAEAAVAAAAAKADEVGDAVGNAAGAAADKAGEIAVDVVDKSKDVAADAANVASNAAAKTEQAAGTVADKATEAAGAAANVADNTATKAVETGEAAGKAVGTAIEKAAADTAGTVEKPADAVDEKPSEQ